MKSLQRGEGIEVALQKVCVGLGWSPNDKGGDNFDLDASAFMLDERGKLPRDEYFVFYNNLTSPDGSIYSSGDEQDGRNGTSGDCETLTVDLPKVNHRIREIIFTATIYKADERKQNFGQVHNSYIRIYNALTNDELAKYDLEEDFSVETAIAFGRLVRKNSGWTFEAMGVGNRGGLQYFVDKYAK